ncbi:LysR substrate-binding domain-containing protein [Noviherbaspirillum album]|nr:LysR substrate-binding domain-containing protein [Noviherbaspirillum sp. CPCC 100848]
MPYVDILFSLLSNENLLHIDNHKVMADLIEIERYIRRSMKIRHLHLLVELAVRKSIGDTATAINVTQPAVSKMLSEIEEGIGLPLFERVGRVLIPTVYGQCLIRHAREILASVQFVSEELRSLSGGVVGKVVIGMMSVAAPVLIPQMVGLLKQSWPGINLSLREGSMEEHLSDLRVGKLDLVVGRLLKEFSSDDLHEEVLLDDPVVLVVASNHPLAYREEVEWHELNGLPWILPPEGAPMRLRLESLLATHNVSSPNNVVESISLLANLSLLQAYPVLGLYPQSLARQHETSGLLRVLPLSLGQVLTPVGMVWLSNRLPSPALETVQETMRSAVRIIR